MNAVPRLPYCPRYEPENYADATGSIVSQIPLDSTNTVGFW